jgi:hypothetical protein
MIDVSRWNEEELFVFKQYEFRCVLHPWVWADTLHHEPPRSLNPRWIDEPWTQYPVCAECHDKLQDMPREQAATLLKLNQEQLYPNAIKEIREYAATLREPATPDLRRSN